jgi:hypothetical protein
MKMKRASVEFTKTIDVTVYVPESMTQAEINRIAEDLAFEDMNGWDDPPWEAFVGRLQTVDVPDADCVLETRPARFGSGTVTRPVRDTTFDNENVVVVNDDHTDFVSPIDATWWNLAGPATPEVEP